MVTPPWVQGTFDPEGDWVVGEQRLEQLCSVTGTVTLDGADDRVHRWRPSHPPKGREPQRLRRLLRAQLAVGVLSERPRLRIHPLPPAARRFGEVPRGLASRRR